jgi:hypothetical protein
VLAALLLAQPGPGLAQSPPASGGAAPAGAPVVAAEAIDALARMGTFLRSHRAFTVRADTTTDQVLDTGQKIQFDSAVDLRARLPDRRRADVRSARMERQFFYDGRTLTLYGARVKYYATVAARRRSGSWSRSRRRSTGSRSGWRTSFSGGRTKPGPGTSRAPSSWVRAGSAAWSARLQAEDRPGG